MARREYHWCRIVPVPNVIFAVTAIPVRSYSPACTTCRKVACRCCCRGNRHRPCHRYQRQGNARRAVTVTVPLYSTVKSVPALEIGRVGRHRSGDDEVCGLTSVKAGPLCGVALFSRKIDCWNCRPPPPRRSGRRRSHRRPATTGQVRSQLLQRRNVPSPLLKATTLVKSAPVVTCRQPIEIRQHPEFGWLTAALVTWGWNVPLPLP